MRIFGFWIAFSLALLPQNSSAQILDDAQSWWEDFLTIETEEEKIRDLYDQIAQHVGLQNIPELYLPPEKTNELCGQDRSVNDTINAYYCLTNRSIAVTRALLDETKDPDSTLNFLSLAFVIFS